MSSPAHMWENIWQYIIIIIIVAICFIYINIFLYHLIGEAEDKSTSLWVHFLKVATVIAPTSCSPTTEAMASSESEPSTLPELQTLKASYPGVKVLRDVGDFKYIVNVRPEHLDISFKFQLSGKISMIMYQYSC